MNTPKINATQEEAQEKLDEYKRSPRLLKDPQYQKIVQAYEWLAKGYKLIDVGDAIREAGLDAESCPRLALARADRKQIQFTWLPHSETVSFDSNSNRNGQIYPQLVERISMGQTQKAWITRYAIVPLVPAGIRPSGLQYHHILWEVDKWHKERIGAFASRDP